jgi:hypothetical protein
MSIFLAPFPEHPLDVACFFDEHIGINRGGGLHELYLPLRLYSPALAAADLVDAPGGYLELERGFRHNGYSAPWFAAPLVWRADLRPAAGHDKLCGGEIRGVTRELADRVMRELMQAKGVGCTDVKLNWAQRRYIYRGVRIGDHLNIGGQGDETVVAPEIGCSDHSPGA